MLTRYPRLRLVGRRMVQIIPVIVLATFVVFGLLKLVPGVPAGVAAGAWDRLGFGGAVGVYVWGVVPRR